MLATMRFFAVLPPDERIEVSRLQMTTEQMHRMVDLICRNTGYVPNVGAVEQRRI